MNKEKVEDVKAFLDGEFNLDELLDVEGTSLFDFDLPFSAHISVSSTPLKEAYRFEIDAYNYMAGVSSDELDVSLMESYGFEDYGVTGGPVELEELECAECGWKASSDVTDFDTWCDLLESMKCPKCDSEIYLTRYYDHVHLEGTKTVELKKREVERLIEESKSITEFAEKLLEKMELC